MWKKLLTVAAMGTAFAAAPAHAFLLNWTLDPDGAGGPAGGTLINEFLDIVGPSYVETTVPNMAGQFTFNEFGAVVVQGHDGGAPISFAPNSGALAALFDISGNATLGGAVNYTGGTISVYSNVPSTFSSTDGIYGANTGTLIGTFSPTTGTGLIDPTGIPNGLQTISAMATFLAPGYFFDGATDLSTLTGSGLVFGFATTNASYVVQPSANAVSELVGEGGTSGPFTNCLPGQVVGDSAVCTGLTGAGSFIISNNGQYRLQVPEPGSLALVGLSILVLGAFTRRRMS